MSAARPEPRILAGFVQDSLAAVDRHDPALGRALRERLEPEVLESIGKASTIAWLPVELDVALTEALFAVAGPATAARILRDNMVQSFDKPFLRPLIDGALRILGSSPERLLRWAPKAWSVVYRECGALAFEVGDVDGRTGAGTLHLRDLPRAVCASRPYLRGVAAALEGAFALTRAEGSCELESHAPDAGTATLSLHWR